MLVVQKSIIINTILILNSLAISSRLLVISNKIVYDYPSKKVVEGSTMQSKP